MSLILDNGNPLAPAMADRWTPRRDGAIYCSPACGGRCRWADFEAANARAGTLARQLGHGWQPRVWENLGWHVQVKKGGATVTVTGEGRYHASVRFSLDGRSHHSLDEVHHDPREAVAAVIARIERGVATLRRQLLSVSPSPPEIEDVVVAAGGAHWMPAAPGVVRSGNERKKH
jgi:hypothetical protein